VKKHILSFVAFSFLSLTHASLCPQNQQPVFYFDIHEAAQRISHLPQKTLKFLQRHVGKFLWSLKKAPNPKDAISDWKTVVENLEIEKKDLEEHYENICKAFWIPRYIYIPAWIAAIVATWANIAVSSNNLEDFLIFAFSILTIATSANEFICWRIKKRAWRNIEQKRNDLNATKVKMYEERK